MLKCNIGLANHIVISQNIAWINSGRVEWFGEVLKFINSLRSVFVAATIPQILITVGPFVC